MDWITIQGKIDVKRQTSETRLFMSKFKKEDMSNEEYPPLFQFYIIRDIGLRLPIQVQGNL